ncbi:hypothetical protein C0584_03945 [Candidatus Parcubacteria bacterium]|nr:MAG: hypothetical protein C0584_03945 [Candidatus Parcubacteria bacterium]
MSKESHYYINNEELGYVLKCLERLCLLLSPALRKTLDYNVCNVSTICDFPNVWFYVKAIDTEQSKNNRRINDGIVIFFPRTFGAMEDGNLGILLEETVYSALNDEMKEIIDDIGKPFGFIPKIIRTPNGSIAKEITHKRSRSICL